MNNLEEKIISVLKNEGQLKAKDIAQLVNETYNDNYDKKEINQVLYYKLNDQVYQSNDYFWSLGKGKKKVKTEKTPFSQTPLMRLSSYYIDCLSKDMDMGVWNYASSKYGSPDYGQLFHLPHFSQNSDNIYSSEDTRNTINKVRRDRNRLVLQLGYLINLRKVTSRRGYVFYVVEPILLSPFDTKSFMNSGDPILQEAIPQINAEAIKNLTGLTRYELFEELINIQEELGLNNPISEQPNFEELSMRLQKIRPNWAWVESVNPEELTTVELKRTATIGIYNSAALFHTERSRYTQGLEKELNDFRLLQSQN